VPVDHLVVCGEKDGDTHLHVHGENEKHVLISENVSIVGLENKKNGVFDKFLSPEAG
jgi:hypothetical protein